MDIDTVREMENRMAEKLGLMDALSHLTSEQRQETANHLVDSMLDVLKDRGVIK